MQQWGNITDMERYLFEKVFRCLETLEAMRGKADMETTNNLKGMLCAQYDVEWVPGFGEPEPAKIRIPAKAKPSPARIAQIRGWVDLVDEAMGWCDDISDSDSAIEFATSVRGKLEAFSDCLNRGLPLTHGQEQAVINMREGLEKWMR